MSAVGTLAGRWSAIRDRIEIADVGFLLLRITALAGNVGWLLFVGMSAEAARAFLRTSLYFIAYNLVLYLLLFLASPTRISATSYPKSGNPLTTCAGRRG